MNNLLCIAINAANNPVKYVDRDGRIIGRVSSDLVPYLVEMDQTPTGHSLL